MLKIDQEIWMNSSMCLRDEDEAQGDIEINEWCVEPDLEMVVFDDSLQHNLLLSTNLDVWFGSSFVHVLEAKELEGFQCSIPSRQIPQRLVHTYLV